MIKDLCAFASIISAVLAVSVWLPTLVAIIHQ